MCGERPGPAVGCVHCRPLPPDQGHGHRPYSPSFSSSFQNTTGKTAPLPAESTQQKTGPAFPALSKDQDVKGCLCAESGEPRPVQGTLLEDGMLLTEPLPQEAPRGE